MAAAATLTGTVSRTCRRIRGGWQNAFVRGLNLSCEGWRVENDESFDFTALRITRLLVTIRNEISREEEEEFFPDVISSFRYFDFLHLVYGRMHGIIMSTLTRRCVLWIRYLSFHSLHFSLCRNKRDISCKIVLSNIFQPLVW